LPAHEVSSEMVWCTCTGTPGTQACSVRQLDALFSCLTEHTPYLKSHLTLFTPGTWYGNKFENLVVSSEEVTFLFKYGAVKMTVE
jgi:hypothetical protein